MEGEAENSISNHDLVFSGDQLHLRAHEESPQ